MCSKQRFLCPHLGVRGGRRISPHIASSRTAPWLPTGGRFNGSVFGLLPVCSEDLVDPSCGDSGQLGYLLGVDALFMQGDDELATFLVEAAWAGNPEHTGVIFLDLLEQFLGQDLSRVSAAT